MWHLSSQNGASIKTIEPGPFFCPKFKRNLLTLFIHLEEFSVSKYPRSYMSIIKLIFQHINLFAMNLLRPFSSVVVEIWLIV